MLAYLVNFAYTASAHFCQNQWEHPYILETSASKKWKWAGWSIHFAGILFVLASLVLFLCGVYKIQHTIAHWS